ncbi:carbohydrate-binding domain-containing protein, partial [Leuconostoc mesenteroides]|uniref:carbohydrate-binding domain-containing protein n=1 Tax=Leuconostoc mesenteroides TaxID=1245 RepID=UPI002361F554
TADSTSDTTSSATDASTADSTGDITSSVTDTTSNTLNASTGNTSNIAFNSSSAIITGDGATSDGNTVTISEAGTYNIEGTATDAQIIVNAPVTAAVKLVFNNVDLANQIGAVLNGKQFGSLSVEVVGTNNITTSVVVEDEESLDTTNLLVY